LAIRKFAEAIASGRPITLFGDGSSSRDYTYVDDIVTGIQAAMTYRQTPFEIVNLGNSHAISLMDLVRELESAVERNAVVEWLPAQQGDVEATCADLTKAQRLLAYQPTTSLSAGLRKTVDWLHSRDAKVLENAR
jgi:UDP-glucuronate 4-epimerase